MDPLIYRSINICRVLLDHVSLNPGDPELSRNTVAALFRYSQSAPSRISRGVRSSSASSGGLPLQNSRYLLIRRRTSNTVPHGLTNACLYFRLQPGRSLKSLARQWSLRSMLIGPAPRRLSSKIRAGGLRALIRVEHLRQVKSSHRVRWRLGATTGLHNDRHPPP